MRVLNLMVVMYHYVRELKQSRFPEIKGLDYSLFEEQVLFLKKHYNLVTVEQVIAAYEGYEPLPPKPVLLTFDDGYIDHYTKVFPFLYNQKIQGAFYPPVMAITENRVLDVNKIHFILASGFGIDKILELVKKSIEEYRQEYNLETYAYYFEKLAISNRYDCKEVIFFKRLLQVELKEDLRMKITNEIFNHVVSTDESSFGRELYLSEEQLKCMVDCGMHVGSHGYNHYWLGSLSKEQQRVEITKSLEFIKRIGGNTNQWSICYPYGNYNDDTIQLLTEYNCKLGFTTRVDIAAVQPKNGEHLIIPRLDTNDLPKDRSALTDNWFSKMN